MISWTLHRLASFLKTVTECKFLFKQLQNKVKLVKGEGSGARDPRKENEFAKGLWKEFQALQCVKLNLTPKVCRRTGDEPAGWTAGGLPEVA